MLYEQDTASAGLEGGGGRLNAGVGGVRGKGGGGSMQVQEGGGGGRGAMGRVNAYVGGDKGPGGMHPRGGRSVAGACKHV